ncbi:MAG: ribosome maturation factor RimP [Clostridia bacterium]|nr:ribosome maturation factor RimP [Clostridia bacterium]
MKQQTKGIVAEVLALATPVAEELGYTIWDVEYEKIGAEYHLTITIDSEAGIGIEDCEKMSRAIDPVLDEHDPIKEEYHLDVSSPGIERVIKNDFHLSKCIGERVIARLFAPIEGQKAIVGTLKSYDGEQIVLETDKEIAIARKAIAKMNIYFEF